MMSGGQIALILSFLTIVQALSVFVLKSILGNIIKFEFRKREQAAIVAALFAEWISKPINYKDLNRLTWEVTLWLPDNLATEVNKRLSNARDAKDLREILVDVKGVIHGRKSRLGWKDIVYFQQQDL